MALTLDSFGSASGTGDASGGTVTVTLPGTPQAGDTYVLAAVGITAPVISENIQWTSGSGTGWSTHEDLGADAINDAGAFLASRAWQSGDATTQTLEFSGGTAKWLFVGAWLIRPGAGNTVSFGDDGSTNGTSSASPESVTLGSSPVSGDAVVAAMVNDAKETAFSNWEHGSGGVAMTEDAELDEGAGAPGNWSTGGFASVVTTGTSTTVEVDIDDTGSKHAMVAGFFQEVAGTATVYPPWPRHSGQVQSNRQVTQTRM